MIFLVTGATCSGKSLLSLELAKHFDVEIVNADAMQIYKEVPILTDQPKPESFNIVPHHLYGDISILNANCNVFKWLQKVRKLVDEIKLRNKIPLLVGGSYMYIDRLLNGILLLPDVSEDNYNKVNEIYSSKGVDHCFNLLKECDPEICKVLVPTDKQRILRALSVFEETKKPYSEWKKKENVDLFSDCKFFVIQTEIEREELYSRCNARFDKMIANGVVKETKELIDLLKENNVTKIPPIIGVHSLNSFLTGDRTIQDVTAEVKMFTRRYAKRQLTWLKNSLKNVNFTYKNDTEIKLLTDKIKDFLK